jgi:hypothetical protein
MTFLLQNRRTLHQQRRCKARVIRVMSDSLYVMYNTCYGGFGLSNAAMAEYRKRCPGAVVCDYSISRHDSVMAQIVKEMGSKQASAPQAGVGLVQIPSCFVDHYTIEEYDGMESAVVDFDRYKVDTAKTILRDKTTSKTDKLARIAAVMNLEEPCLKRIL